MHAPLPPFAVAPIRFPFRALASRAGRAPLGGEREVAMAALLVARLAHDALGEHALGATQRAERAAGAKGWLASLALPAQARPVFARAMEATPRNQEAIVAALAELADFAARWLDDGSLRELRAITATPLVNSR